MKIEFTNEEMERLLELLDLADYVLNSHDVEDDERKDPYNRLLKRLYTEAYKNGMKEQIEYDEDSQDYYPSEDWEDKSQTHDFIEEYDDATFWEELTYRLADRDIDRELNGKAPGSVKAQIELFTRIQTKYEEEFETNNLDNVEIVKKSQAKKTPVKKDITAKKSAEKKSPAKKTAVKK